MLHICRKDLLCLKLFGELKSSGYLNFLWNYFRMHYIDLKWCTSKWTLGHKQKKREGGGYNIVYTKPDKKITFFRQYLSYFPCQMKWMRNTSRQIAITLYIHRFFKRAGNIRIWMLLFFKWFFLCVSQSFMSLNIRQRNCVIFYAYFFCVYWSEILCANLYIHVPLIPAGMRNTCMNPDVEFT